MFPEIKGKIIEKVEYMVNNGILGLFETMKKSRSISKQKNNSNK